MWEEDYPPPGFRNTAESQYFLFVAALLICVVWVFGGGSVVVDCALAVTLVVGPFLLQGFHRLGAGAFDNPFPLFAVALLPVLFMIGVAIWGIFEPSVERIGAGGTIFIGLNGPVRWIPTSTLAEFHWLEPLARASAYATPIMLIFFVESQYAVRKILNVGAVAVVLVAGLGLFQAVFGAERVLWLVPAGGSAFFGTFSHAHDFAGVGLLWLVVYIGMLRQWIGEMGWNPFLSRCGLWAFAGALALIVSIFWVGASVHRAILALILSVAMLRASVDAFFASRSRRRRLSRGFGFLVSSLAAGVLTVWLSWDAIHSTQPAPFGIPWHEHRALLHQGWEIFMQRPLFGWGVGSYPVVAAFYPIPALSDQLIDNPFSSLLNLLAEQGIFGLVIWSLPVVALCVMYLFSRRKPINSTRLFFAVSVALLLGLVTPAFENMAFLFSFWLLLVCGCLWTINDAKRKILTTSRPVLIFSREELEMLRLSQKKRDEDSEPDSRG